ncbi:MAG TPA: NifU family protein [Flavobacterium sp.]|nr:NifU family protein [Flavobacterium sp.]
MLNVIIKETQDPTILKFELPEFIAKNENFEYHNIDEAKDSPLAQQLFYLPFVKAVYISGNFIAIQRYNIVEWDDVKEAVAEQIENFISKGGTIVNLAERNIQKQPVTVYAESTPNPSVQKFVGNKMMARTAMEFKNIDEAYSSPLAAELFKFPYVKEVFIDENYISITKYGIKEWPDITFELRTFIKEYIENGGKVIDESKVSENPKLEKQKIENFDSLDATSQKIINILEEYVKPAVAADGGNIVFDSYDETDKRVKVVLQGACSGCPSSTFTLKSGIENMLKDMLKDEEIKVEALNS